MEAKKKAQEEAIAARKAEQERIRQEQIAKREAAAAARQVCLAPSCMDCTRIDASHRMW